MSNKSGGYAKVVLQTTDDEFYKSTAARINKIKSHLSQAPRGTRLQDKVCIITGVGSLKGIG